MPVLLFWNVKKGAATSYVPAVCAEHNVDVAILVEEPSDAATLARHFNAAGASDYKEYAPVPSEVRIVSRLPEGRISLVSDRGGRCSIRSIVRDDGSSIIVAACHITSRIHYDDEDQYFQVRQIRTYIENAEKNLGHCNTIIIGDMNMNPFDVGMSAFDGFHGVMSRGVASKLRRTFSGESSTFFYNPMWSRLGDESHGPPGTYFYSGARNVQHFWHTFDQVLMRPGVAVDYKPENLKVLTKIGSKNLIRNNKIDSSISDHLPIVLDVRSI